MVFSSDNESELGGDLLVLSDGPKSSLALHCGAVLALRACGRLAKVETVVGVGFGNFVATAMEGAWKSEVDISHLPISPQPDGMRQPETPGGHDFGDVQSDEVLTAPPAYHHRLNPWSRILLAHIHRLCFQNQEAQALFSACWRPWETLTVGWHPALHRVLDWPSLWCRLRHVDSMLAEAESRLLARDHRSLGRHTAKDRLCAGWFRGFYATRQVAKRGVAETTGSTESVTQYSGRLYAGDDSSADASSQRHGPSNRSDSRPTQTKKKKKKRKKSGQSFKTHSNLRNEEQNDHELLDGAGDVVWDPVWQTPFSRSRVPTVWHAALGHSAAHVASSAGEWQWRQDTQPFHTLAVGWNPVMFRYRRHATTSVSVQANNFRWVTVAAKSQFHNMLTMALAPASLGVWDVSNLPSVISAADTDPLAEGATRQICRARQANAPPSAEEVRLQLGLGHRRHRHDTSAIQAPVSCNNLDRVPRQVILLDGMAHTLLEKRLEGRAPLVAGRAHLEAHRAWINEYNAVTSEQEENERGTYRTRPGGSVSDLVQLATSRAPGGTCAYTTCCTDIRPEGQATKFDSFVQFQDDTYRWVASLDHRLEAISELDFHRLVNWGFLQALLQWAPHNETTPFAPWSMLVPADTLKKENASRPHDHHDPIGHTYTPVAPSCFRGAPLIWNPMYTLPYPHELHSQSWIREFRDSYL